jgi:cadmium resistance protein CadD (predicted permease)
VAAVRGVSGVGVVATAVGVFAGTNVDDLLVLTTLFLGGGAVRRVVAGQYLGFGVLVAASGAVAAGLLVVPDRWVGLLGLVPLALGLRAWVRVWLRRGEPAGQVGDAAVAGSVWSVAGVTMANGGDNLGVYVPLFRTLSAGAVLVTLGVFAVALAGWCLAARWLSRHRVVVAAVARIGHHLVPAVFVLVGLAVLSQLLR